MSESKLQSICYQWFHNEAYPEQRGRLYMNLNNPPNRIQGAILKGMGLVAGVADMTYLLPNATLVFIEFKTESKASKQSLAQVEWASLVRSLGFRYEVIRTEVEFKNLITELNTNKL